MEPIKVILVDDHKIVRDGIRAMAIGNKTIKIIGEASDNIELDSLLQTMKPDVLILDIALPGKSGIEIAKEMVRDFTDVKILILTSLVDEETITNSIFSGAHGFLSKETSKAEFFKAIETVYNNENYFGEKLTTILYNSYVKNVRKPGSVPENINVLSEREIEVLRFFAEGLSAKEIAEKLFISARTVETHKANILGKLDMKNSVDLVKYAIKQGIIEI